MLAAARDQHLEGVVAKQLESPYQPGARARSWLKVKNVRTQEVLVAGWKPGQGRRAGGIGSLLLAIPSTDGLRYVGKVGTGFTDAARADLQRRLEPLATSTSPLGADVPRADALGRALVFGPSSSARCGSPSGPASSGCGTPRGEVCGRTRTPTRSPERADPSTRVR